jgi:hypothetical protein
MSDQGGWDTSERAENGKQENRSNAHFRKRVRARFGILAVAGLAVGLTMAILVYHVRLGVGNPLSAWGVLLYILACAAAFVLGIVGLVLDENKVPAIFTVVAIPAIMVSC